MKKFVFCLCVALLTTISSEAQQISVVSPSGTTTLYRTLQESIEGADPGSVIYLPGGGFQISDEVKITNKKLTIIGIGHYANNGNADGITTISGNLFFNEGSSGSAVIGCYITGNVYIGEGGASVNDVLIRQCNLNSVQVTNSSCVDTQINQSYLRNTSSFNGANALLMNNIIHSINNINGDQISNNIILGSWLKGYQYYTIVANRSNILNNVITINPWRSGVWGHDILVGSDNVVISNMTPTTFGDLSITVGGDVDWNDVFVNNGGISPVSDFHFTDAYKQYENQVGIYAGTGFNKQVTSVPYIIYKDVPTETDAQGMLKVKIRVKANQ
ncbi:MAG: hypothetical protein IKX24_06280 [Prevotella sp.]|nr:hypothetical protein [Prevotella sp.]